MGPRLLKGRAFWAFENGTPALKGESRLFLCPMGLEEEEEEELGEHGTTFLVNVSEGIPVLYPDPEIRETAGQTDKS
ncbi:unnamed protein product [Lota lota]